MATPAKHLDPHSHWSKDYVEHLRTVHFTLVVVCIALVVLITSDRKSTVSNAREELKGIRAVAEKWDRDWIKKEAAISFAGMQLPVAQLPADAGHSEVEIDLPNGKSVVMQLVYDGPNWMMNASDDSLRSPIPYRYPLLLQEQPLFLNGFHEFWDSLAKRPRFEVPLTLDDTPRAFHQGQPLTARFVSGKKPTISTPLHLKLSIRQIEADARYEYPKGSYVSEPGLLMPFATTYSLGDGVAVPITGSKSVFADVYAHFIPADSGWRREPYNDVFPNLSSVTKNYEQLNFETVDKILEAEESRAGDSFEAIGIKFPAEGVSQWGFVLILGIQIYFFLHLYELTPKLKASDEGWEVAWIGVYKSHLARTVYFISTVLLPAAAALVLLNHLPALAKSPHWLRITALILGAGLSLSFGLLAWMRLRKSSG